MKLSAREVLSGTSTAKTKAGSCTFTVQATEGGQGAKATARQVLTLAVSA